MTLLPADFNTCSQKCACCLPNQPKIYYNCSEPCPPGPPSYYFDASTCSCKVVPPPPVEYGRTTWRIEGYSVSADHCSFDGVSGITTCGPPYFNDSFEGAEVTTTCGPLPQTAEWSAGDYCEPTGTQCKRVKIGSTYIIRDADGNSIGGINTNFMIIDSTCSWTAGHCPAPVSMIFTQSCPAPPSP